MCDCYKIGGPFIAEDPDCPEHGTAAQERDERIFQLRRQIQASQDIDQIRGLVDELFNLL